MTDVATDPRPALAVIPDVEICHVGEKWPLLSDGTEDGTFTPEDLAAAVEAQDDPSIRPPVIKFGHTAAGSGKLALGDAAPVWGRATNLRLADEGMTLVGDFTGVPVWLAEILPSAYPSRSLEGRRNYTSDIGHTHDLVITGVALLGVELPAISTLAEVQAVWTARTPEQARVTLKEDSMPQATRRTAQVAAATTTEDIRRAYYDTLPSGSYWWIREMSLDPLMLIVEADDGDLYQVPVTVSGTDITFGTPSEVRVEYVPADDGAPTSASRRDDESIVFANRAESRKGVPMDPVELRKSLGLAEDVSDEDVTARIAELAARPEPTDDPPPTPEPKAAVDDKKTEDPPAGVVVPPGFKLVADAVLDEMQAGIAEGVAAARTLAKQGEDAFIQRHRARIGPSSNPHASRTEAHLRREWQRNQGEAEAFAASLPKRAATEPAGHEQAPDLDDEDALYAAVFGKDS